MPKTLIDLRPFIEQERTDFNLSRVSKQIAQLKRELNRSFPEFDDVRET